MSTLSLIAESIWDYEFYWKEELKGSEYSSAAQERQIETEIIADWLDAHLGELNLMINTNFKSEAGDVDGLAQEEASILTEMYLLNYYRKQSRNLLRSIDGSTDSTVDFQSIREGDSVITMNTGGKQGIARNYRVLMQESQDRIDKLVHSYNMYQSRPSQVSGDDAPA